MIMRALKGAVLIAALGFFANANVAMAGDMDGWVQQVRKKIADNQRYPRSAQVRGASGTVKAKVTVDGSGAISSVELVEKTDFDVLNTETENMFQRVGNFPAPPGNQSQTLILPISYAAP